MVHETCVFCRIIAKELPTELVAENDSVIVIKDRAPKAPIHYLIIPKRHITDLHAIHPSDKELMGELLLMANQVAREKCDMSAFNLVVNNGHAAGQRVFHLHIHFLVGTMDTFL